MKDVLTIVGILIFASGSIFGLANSIVLNLTSSYPEGVYWLSETDRIEGDLVWFDDISGIAQTRGYIPTNAKLMKEIVAKEGTRFCVGDEFRVGGVSFGRVYSTDSLGRQLPVRSGCAVVPMGHVLVASSTDKSFDSRYLGPIPVARIHGKLEALWIW